MRKAIFTLIILAIIVVGVIARIKTEETYVKATTEKPTESVLTTESKSIPQTTEKPSETNTEPILTETETETTEKITETTKKTENLRFLGRYFITGYTAEEGFGYGSVTASGVGVKPGICAMNDAERRALGIKYGDTLVIANHGEYKVQDSGCAEGVVDIWYYTDREAMEATGYYDVWVKE